MANFKEYLKYHAGSIIAGLVFACCVALGAVISKCSREKSAKIIQTEKVRILKRDNTDSLKAEKYRQIADSAIRAANVRIKANESLTQQLEKQAREKEKVFIQVPSKENGSAAIAAQKKIVGTLKERIQEYKIVRGQDSSKILSYQGQLKSAYQTRDELITLVDKATDELSKAKLPKRWGLSVSAGAAINAGSFKPVPYVGAGVSYSLIRWRFGKNKSKRYTKN